jgi:hypothetical protein
MVTKKGGQKNFPQPFLLLSDLGAFYFDVDLDPQAFHFDANPDPDPQHWLLIHGVYVFYMDEI